MAPGGDSGPLGVLHGYGSKTVSKCGKSVGATISEGGPLFLKKGRRTVGHDGFALKGSLDAVG